MIYMQKPRENVNYLHILKVVKRIYHWHRFPDPCNLNWKLQKPSWEIGCVQSDMTLHIQCPLVHQSMLVSTKCPLVYQSILANTKYQLDHQIMLVSTKFPLGYQTMLASSKCLLVYQLCSLAPNVHWFIKVCSLKPNVLLHSMSSLLPTSCYGKVYVSPDDITARWQQTRLTL